MSSASKNIALTTFSLRALKLQALLLIDTNKILKDGANMSSASKNIALTAFRLRAKASFYQ